MAFDELVDPIARLESLIELGIDRVLTKGSKTNATDGIETLKQLMIHAAGRIAIVAGGGVSTDNFQMIADATGVKEVHGTKIVGVYYNYKPLSICKYNPAIQNWNAGFFSYSS